MHSAIYSVLSACAFFGTQPGESVGYLWFYKPDASGKVCKTVEPYVPREGDIVFFDDMSKFWEFLYWIGHTKPPFHSGIVFKKPDGTLALLESGPDDTLHVYLLDVCPRLN